MDCQLQISHLVYLTLANNSVLWVIHCEERITLLTNNEWVGIDKDHVPTKEHVHLFDVNITHISY